MGYSLREAAQQSGVAKSTILRAIKAGKLSAGRLDDGGYDIDPSELARVYPPQRSEPDAMGHAATLLGLSQDPRSDRQTGKVGQVATLEAEIAGLREILRRADEATIDLRQDRDRWRAAAEQSQRLLADQRPRSWWQRLVG